MSIPIESKGLRDLGQQLACAWQGWKRRRTKPTEIGGAEERGRVARDLERGRFEASVFAGKWPDSLDLLSGQLDQVKLGKP
jgi:hypothetical protein